ncbi:unnamed protein product [Psylliodes chrysocephalus]|uniref:Uncharacterized protein n=1 Tax=Psylliodes chrysocephalus TaxID=3402493 RepID=A0A9P0GB23_9CUCU|nr:unnamed protein product [Psylliodes chrysocephala]
MRWYNAFIDLNITIYIEIQNWVVLTIEYFISQENKITNENIQSDDPFFDFEEEEQESVSLLSKLPVPNNSTMASNYLVKLEVLKYLNDSRTNLDMLNDYRYIKLDVKGCKQNLSSNVPTRNRSSSNAFQLAPYVSPSPRGILERRTSQTLASNLKIVRSVSRESVRSIHHCTCPCLSAPVRESIL